MICEIRNRQTCLDALAAAWCTEYQRSGRGVFCAKGCRNCCSLAVNATLGEAVLIAAELTAQQDDALQAYVDRLLGLLENCTEITGYLRMYRQELGFCPFLGEDGACAIYAYRPLSCRALLSTRENTWCGQDFSALSSAEKQAFVEGLDLSAVAFPTHYAASTRDTGQELEAVTNQRMKELFGFSLYGSLPAMVYLVRRQGLADACLRGADAAAQIIAGAAMDNAFLLNLER